MVLLVPLIFGFLFKHLARSLAQERECVCERGRERALERARALERER